MDIYQHFKGNIYIKLTEAIHTETKEELVIYICTKSGKVFARPKEMFYDFVDKLGYKGKRFIRKGENDNE
jgi:hypothetical protein